MKILSYKSLLLATAIAGTTSCSLLDLGPIDYFGSGSYWKTEEQVGAYMDGMHKHLRDQAFQHTIVYGELRGDAYADVTASTDGSTLSYGTLRNQTLTRDAIGGPSGFGNLFGRITNCNLFIAEVTDAAYMTNESEKNFYLAQAYALRAFYYFDLYRIYGGVPLRTGIEVIEGERDPNILYKPRATPGAVMDQIKSDLDKSLELFGDQDSFTAYGQTKKVFWNKAATEALMAEVYLWTAKTTTYWTTELDGEANDVANPADITVAKKHLENLVSNYNLALQPKFENVFSTKHKANDEIIFAIRYQEGEATNSNGSYLYSTATGQTQASAYRADGKPWNDPLNCNSYSAYQYSEDTYNIFDATDQRRDATFIVSYNMVVDSTTTVGVNDTSFVYRGSFVQKNIGQINAEGSRVYDGDYILYRLAWVYLSLAEVANFEGNNADVEKYINLVRERAYGENWDVAKYGYTASDYTTNEFAILDEKTKEFIQEGQRWFDVRRMTVTKGGMPVVFDKRSSLDGQNPILPESESYKLLWPLDQGIMNNDPKIKQTPGYN